MLLLFGLHWFLAHFAQCFAQPSAPVWDLLSPPEETTAVYFRDANGGQLGVPVQAGDFNGDGFQDVAATPFYASTKGRTRNGILEIYFGDGSIGETIDRATYTGPMLTVHGAETNSFLGVEIHRVDLDRDGYTDLVLGSSHGLYRSIAEAAGEVVILYGRAEWGDSVRELDIRTLPVSQRAQFILGERQVPSGSPRGDRLGSWIQSGDLDGDGFLELVLGMDQSAGFAADRTRAGAAVIAWKAGFSHPESGVMRVGDVAHADAITIIYGIDAGDMFGATHLVADLDGNDELDLVISAGVIRSGLSLSALGYSGTGGGDGPTNARRDSGETTILWDAGRLRNYQRIQMASYPAELDSSIIYGELGSSYFGEELVAGDVDGDGIDDLLIGALGYRAGGLNLAGAAYLFTGGAGLRAVSSLDLASPQGYPVVVFDGVEFSGIAGDTLECYDTNRDGKADIFFSVPYGTFGDRVQTGYTTVLFGGQNFATLPARYRIGLIPIPLMHAHIVGADSPNGNGDFLAYSSTFGDINGDGVPDYIPNAMQGDGYLNSYMNAGEFYIVDGWELSRLAAMPLNLRAGTNAFIAEWDAGQPVLGNVVGYQLRFRGTESSIDTILIVNETQLTPADIPDSGVILGVRTIMEGEDEMLTSRESLFAPPLQVMDGPRTLLWMLY